MLENIPCVPYQQAVSTVFLGKFFSINLYKEGTYIKKENNLNLWINWEVEGGRYLKILLCKLKIHLKQITVG